MSKSKELYLGRCFTLTTAFGSLRKISLGPQDLQKLNYGKLRIRKQRRESSKSY